MSKTVDEGKVFNGRVILSRIVFPMPPNYKNQINYVQNKVQNKKGLKKININVSQKTFLLCKIK